MANTNNTSTQKKYASLQTLQTFLSNLKNIFASLTHTHSYEDLRNKPFYEGTDYSSIFVSTVNFYDWGGVYGAAITDASKAFTQNTSYKVIWDGVEYAVTGTYGGENDAGNTIVYLGAPYGDYSTYPFGIDSYQNSDGTYQYSIHTNSSSSTHTIDILELGSSFVTMDERFIPDSIARTDDVDTAINELNNNKADKVHNHAISDVTNLQTTLDTMNENLRNNTWYGTCSTAAATTEKVVATANGDFELETGNIIYVLFTYASCVNATLNVDGKGAKAIKIVGNNNVSTYHWALNEVVGFAYDGTYFRMLDGQVATTTYYGVTKLSSSTSSTSTTAAATPSAVKAAYDLANSKQDPATTLSGYGITDAYTKSDHDWVQIYDSGETTEQINSFANINISGYKKLMIAIKCVNDTTNASTTRYGSAIFKATNGTIYQFPVFNSMFFGSATTTASIGFFEFIDGWIVCPQVVRSIKYSDFLTSTEGGTCTNMNNMGSGLMKCTNPLSTVTISNLDQNADFFFGVGSRVVVWGCNA